MRYALLTVVLLGVGLVTHAEETLIRQHWLTISLEEIDYAKPVIADATIPISLAEALLGALPPTWATEIREEGFQLQNLIAKARLLRTDESFVATTDSYEMTITKRARDVDPSQTPSYLVIQSPETRIPFPLMVTSVAVNGLQLLMKEFKGMDAELALFVEELKKTPPGLLYEEYDEMDDSWMKVMLE